MTETAVHTSPKPDPANRNRKPFYRKKRILIPTAVVIFGIAVGSCSAGSGKPAAAVHPVATPTSAASPSPSSSDRVPVAAPAAAKTAAPVKTVAPAEPKVGVPFTVPMRNGDVARITIASAVRTQSLGDSVMAVPPKNGEYLLLDVLWETQTGETSSNPFYFSAKDSQGRKADQNLFVHNQLGAGKIVPGDKSRGSIAFDIASGPATVMISDLLLQEAARIQIPG
ncbi:hypothetical protein IV498_02280 [Paenarthrobacter sp. Z7-10]|nr:hypothetical protein [Paenarthrobacter sp. Z7-10]